MQNSSQSNTASTNSDSYFCSGENDTDLCEILDLAVAMLQDLDQHRKDSVRTVIQQQTISNILGGNSSATGGVTTVQQQQDGQDGILDHR